MTEQLVSQYICLCELYIYTDIYIYTHGPSCDLANLPEEVLVTIVPMCFGVLEVHNEAIKHMFKP